MADTEIRPRGTCPACGRDFHLYANGTLRRHSVGIEKRSPVCEGSGQPPGTKAGSQRVAGMPRPWSLAEVRDAILREPSVLAAFAETAGIPTDAAPPEIAAQVARVNELLAELNPLLDEIAAACGVQED